MKFNYKKDISPKYLLLALSILSIVLLVLSAVFPSKMSVVRGIVGEFITPLQENVSKVGQWFDDKQQLFQDIEELEAENERLQNELNTYRNSAEKNEAELAELTELRDLYELDQMYPDYTMTAARVFSVNTSGWFDEFYIDKGLNDGVYEDCNVVTDNGLLGIVEESYDNYAKVRAIIDDRSVVTAEIGSAGALCSVEGSLIDAQSGYLTATNIDRSASISEGDKVITSSVSDRYLYGITIGYVSEISYDSNNLTKTAIITPVVSFNDIKDVLIILDRKQEVNY